MTAYITDPVEGVRVNVLRQTGDNAQADLAAELERLRIAVEAKGTTR